MKKLIIAAAISLASTGALALDKTLDPNENYQSPLADHGPAPKATQLGEGHDHGDDTVKDFVKHGHDMPVKPDEHSKMGKAMHDHGDDVAKDFVPHKD